MRRHAIAILGVTLLCLSLSSNAFSQNVILESVYKDVNDLSQTTLPKSIYGESGGVYTYLTAQHVGMFPVLVGEGNDQVLKEMYCLDLFQPFKFDEPYEAVKIPVGDIDFSIWPHIAYVLNEYSVSDSVNPARTACINQTALWKFFYYELFMDHTLSPFMTHIAPFPTSGYPDPEDPDEIAAQNLMVEAQDKMPFACIEENGKLTIQTEYDPLEGMIKVILIAEQKSVENGEIVEVLPASYQRVTLLCSDGVFVDKDPDTPDTHMIDGITDENGHFMVWLDAECEKGITIEAHATGKRFYWLIPADGETFGGLIPQTLLCHETTEFSAYKIVECPIGDPHTIGFWKHQIRMALRDRKSQVSKEDLISMLAEGVNTCDPTVNELLKIDDPTDESEVWDKLTNLYAVLWLRKAPMRLRAIQQSVATQLNYLYGEVSDFTMVDIDYDKQPDVYFYEAMEMACEYYNNGDYEAAKDIYDSINNM